MGDWQETEEDEVWETFFDFHVPEGESLFPFFVRLLDEHSRWRKKRKKTDEEMESSYNVAVYRMLPYPPNTKDVKDFFLLRTERGYGITPGGPLANH